MGALLVSENFAQPFSLQTSLLLPRARSLLPLLMEATQRLDAGYAAAAAVSLIGAGPGLTPSWDDFLVGFLVGLHRTAAVPAQLEFLKQVGAAIGTASQTTTALSRHYLVRATAGRSPPWLKGVVAAITTGAASKARLATDDALQIGHSTGMDMMIGVLFGTSVWEADARVSDMLEVLMQCAPTTAERPRLSQEANRYVAG
jgi:hypothetical protein